MDLYTKILNLNQQLNALRVLIQLHVWVIQNC